MTGITTTAGDVNLDSTGLTINNAIAASTGNVRFVQSGAVTQAAAGTITAAALSTASSVGSVVLEANNAVGTVADSGSGASGALSFNDNTTALIVGSVAAAATAVDPSVLFGVVSGATTNNSGIHLKSAGLTINNAIAAGTGNVRFVDASGITQAAAGTITAATLAVSNTSGSAVLESTNTVTGIVGGNTASGGATTLNDGVTALTVTSVAAVSAANDPDGFFGALSGFTSTNGDVNLKTGGLTINQAVAAGTGSVRFIDSSITQAAVGTITAGSLSAVNSGGSAILESLNSVGTLAGSNTSSGSPLTLNNGANALIVGSIAAAASAADPRGLFAAVAGITTSAGDVDLESGGLAVNQAISASTANVRFVESGSLSEATAVAITAAGLSTTNSGGNTVLEGANHVGTQAASNTFSGGGVTLNNGANALIVGTITAAASAADPNGLFGAVTGIMTTGGDVNLTGGGLTVNQAIAAGTGNVRLIASGNVTQATAGTITAAGLAVQNSGGNSVLESANNVGTRGSSTFSGGASTFNNGANALIVGSVAAAAPAADPNTLFAAVTGITTINGDVNLKSGGLTINQAIAAGTGNVRFVDSGNVTASQRRHHHRRRPAAARPAATPCWKLPTTSARWPSSTHCPRRRVTFNNGTNALIIGSVAAAATRRPSPSSLFGTAVTGIATTNGDVNLKSGGLTINNAIAAGAGNVPSGRIRQSHPSRRRHHHCRRLEHFELRRRRGSRRCQ